MLALELVLVLGPALVLVVPDVDEGQQLIEPKKRNNPSPFESECMTQILLVSIVVQ